MKFVFGIKDCRLWSVLFGVLVMMFWGIFYPHALSYQEQNQLFLWTGDYLFESFATPGGFVRYLAEFIVQFYYYPWLGAILLGVIFGLLFYLVALLFNGRWRLLVVPVLLFVLWQMGDEAITLSFPLSFLLAVALFHALKKVTLWADYLFYPLFFWLIGPFSLVYVFPRCLHYWNRRPLPLKNRVGGHSVRKLFIFPLFLEPFLFLFIFPHQCTVRLGLWYSRYPQWGKLTGGFDRDRYELIRLDYLIRNERWNEIIERAERYKVETPFWSQCVNLALGMNGQLPYRQFDFYQSGRDALIMPMLRDQTSDLPSMEAFYRLGMTNECLRYAFDLQESIPMGRKSGRLTKRIVECCLVSGRYEIARKHIMLLKKSLFYSDWAEEAEQYLGQEDKINAHPVWGEMRRHAFKEDFLYYYSNLAQVFYKLFLADTKNMLAMQYMYGQLLLEGNDYVFMQMIGFVQQYGGYAVMPTTYQDAWACMQGNVMPGSRYADYASRVVNRNNDYQNAQSH